MPLNQVNIEEKSIEYSVKVTYHSDMKCENYDAEISAVEENDGRISLYPVYENSNTEYPFLEFPKDPESFSFIHSDPDRAIAVANMILAFAQMVKNENKKRIDTSTNE